VDCRGGNGIKLRQVFWFHPSEPSSSMMRKGISH
jgi:hypothetical protein